MSRLALSMQTRFPVLSVRTICGWRCTTAWASWAAERRLPGHWLHGVWGRQHRSSSWFLQSYL